VTSRNQTHALKIRIGLMSCASSFNLPCCVQTCWHSCFIQAYKCGCAFGGEWSTRGCCPCEVVIF